MSHAQSRSSRRHREPRPESFHAERNNPRALSHHPMQPSLQVRHWSEDPNALCQQGSWVEATIQYDDQNEDLEAFPQYDQQPNELYYQQYTAVQRPWANSNPNSNTSSAYDHVTPIIAYPSSSPAQSSHQGDPRPTQRNSNPPFSSQRLQHAPPTFHTRSTIQTRNSTSRPAILNIHDQTLQPLDKMQRMLQQDPRAGPYNAVGYVRQDERKYEEYQEDNEALQQTYKGYADWEGVP